MAYDKNKNYRTLIDEAAASGDFETAARLEEERNSKIDGEGLDFEKTYDYQNRNLNTVSGKGRQSLYDAAAETASGGTETFSYENAPQYTSRWQKLIDQVSANILGREKFSYDHTTDPTYLQLEKSYTEAGKKAMEDTMGIVSQRTGGMASSYATQVGQQEYGTYMSELADKIPELRELAYQMYMDEGDLMMAKLGMLQGLEDQDYGKYLDLLSQFNTDRSFRYKAGRDEIADQRYADEWEYQLGRDAVEDQRYTDELAWEREAHRDEIGYNRAADRAQMLAAAGDFSGFKALGYSDADIALLEQAYAMQGEIGSADYEPTLTWPQVKAEIEAGNTSPAVMQAYEYYMGEGYDGNGEDGTEHSHDYNVIQYKIDSGSYTEKQLFGELEAALQFGNITEEEYLELAEYAGL